MNMLNGSSWGTCDIKAVLKDIGTLGGGGGILLYLDEIQYLNKKQQQSLLECIEDGTVTLIASTTENPYFYIYNALLSRCTVFEFKSLSAADVERGLHNAIAKLSEAEGQNIILEEGDIINVDVSTILDGYFSDASRMFKMGKVSERAERIVRVTEECVKLGLEAAKPWGHLGDIADAINTHARANGYSVVEDNRAQRVGLEFHEDPFVSYVTPKGSEMLLVPGMMFTIEPMINEGSPDFFVDEDNDWTVYTMDDGLSAQIEYMVLITENGAEVLTK